MKIFKRVISYLVIIAICAFSANIIGSKTVKAAYSVGSTVYFGAYFQSWLTGNDEEYAKGLSYENQVCQVADGRWVAACVNYSNDYYLSQPIEWIVLKNESDSLTLISKNVLSNTMCGKWADDKDFWDSNRLRAWLNDGFLTYAFNDKERNDILYTDVKSYKMSYDDWVSSGNGYITNTDDGNIITTKDKVFVLDKDEYLKLLPEKYRIGYGTQFSNLKVGPMQWWLRGPAIWFYGNLVNIYVKEDGTVDDSGLTAMSLGRFAGRKGARPVIRVKKNSKHLSITKPIIKLQTSESEKITNNMVSLSGNVYKYSGNDIYPMVTVKNGSSVLKKGTDYTVSYSNNKWAGNAKAVVKGSGNYSGTVVKTFRIKYNGQKAAAYAKKHYKKYNKNFKTIKRLIGGKYDCTNFASQCVYAGGLRMIYPQKISYNNRKYYKTKKYWYMKKMNNKFGWSSTWSCVTKYSLSKKERKKAFGLKEHFKKYRHAKVYSKKYNYSSLDKMINNCEEGDVLQCTFTSLGDKHESHSMVVSKKWKMKNGKYNIRICYHSSDRNINLRKKILKLYDKKDKWTLIKMSNAY